ncbi:AI-2E family transporter [Carnobacteriaceae bacterium 52-44]|jgi:predicted PurR-regulated permease PerM
MNIRKNWHRMLSLLIIVVLVYWAVNNIVTIQNFTNAMTSAFQPFIVGGTLAFILNQPVKIIEKWLVKWKKEYKKWFRPIAIVISFIFVVLVLFFIIFLVIPDLQQTITSFIEVVPNQISNFINWFTNFIDNNPEIVQFVQDLNIDLDSIQQNLINYVQTFATNTLGNIIDFVTTTISSVVTVFIAIVFAFFLLTNKEKITRQLKKVVYSIWSLKWANYIVNVGKKANEIFSNFVGGEIIEAFILGGLVYIGMVIFSFPFSLSVSVITGTLALIPIYGAIIGGVIGFVLISVINFTQAIWFIIFIVVVQQIEGNIIYPRVVGNSVGLPGIWVMVSVTVGGSFFGLVGMLVSVPLISVVYSLISATVNYRLETAGLEVDYDSSDL